MKNLIAFVFGFLYLSCCLSQTVIPTSNMVGNITSVSFVSDSTYLVQVDNINDESDVNYNGTSVLDDGTFVVWKDCERYVVTNISCGTCFVFGSSIKVQITADNSLNGFPAFGLTNIIEENPSGVSGWTSGSPDPDNQCISNYYAPIGSGGSGGGISSINGDTGPSVTLTANEINLNTAIDINNNGSNETQIEAALNAVRIYGTYKDDIEAAANSVPLNGFYQVATGSTCCTAGTIRKRIN